MKKTSNRGRLVVVAATFLIATAVPAAARGPGTDAEATSSSGVEVAQNERERRTREAPQPGIWDIPKDDLAIALLLSALIGAAAGHVYAGIVRPKK